MGPPESFQTGMDVLLGERKANLAGRRIGLLTHAAALTVDGNGSAVRLIEDPDINLDCLMGPEHGLFGQAGPGETVQGERLPGWDLPVYSLYGDHRAPGPEELAAIDTLVIDLQDLGVRCYTYVSTLALALEAAAKAGIDVIVTDRPIPFPGILDGPMLDPAFRSFVAQVPTPLVYGLTPGETARYLVAASAWDVDLTVVPMAGYHARPTFGPGWPPWVPPSTGIRSWESAWCYPATVFTEALPRLDCGRDGALPFQILGAHGLDGVALKNVLEAARLPGVCWFVHPYALKGSEPGPRVVHGVRLVVHDPVSYRPIETGLTLLHAVQEQIGPEALWAHKGARPEFFDQLFGTDTVRTTLQAGRHPAGQIDSWREDHRTFREAVASHRLYG